jgi:hypothetical protein
MTEDPVVYITRLYDDPGELESPQPWLRPRRSLEIRMAGSGARR